MGDVHGNLLEKELRNKKGLKAIKTDKGWSTELQNTQDRVWTSYFSSAHKDLFLENWADGEMVDEIPIDDINIKISAPASLVVENVSFKDNNSNNLLEANEEATISFNLKNIGKGPHTE